MDSVNWEVGPTKGVVEAFMEAIVDPRLTVSFSVDKPPSMDARKSSVARQMHGVVLLYNYCHRKQNPELQFLDFVSFCKLSLTLRPHLNSFMNITTESESTAVNITENQLSLTEKAVKDACDICVALDASKDVVITEGFTISKVAVLVIDSEKENCRLRFQAVTEGVWSLFEKEIGEASLDDKALTQENVGKKRRTNIEMAADDKFVQLAFDAVKDATGIERSELAVLEVHDAYSFTKEKSAARFYMMQYSKQFDRTQNVPLKFLVEMFQGPLVEKYNDEWTTLEAVHYFHMLPYVGFISCWLSRKDLCSPSFSGYNAKSTTKSGDREISQSKISAIPLLEYHKSSPSEGPSGNMVTDENVSKKFNKRSSENSVSDVNIPNKVNKRCVEADSDKEQRIIRPEIFDGDDGVNLQVVEKRLVLKSNDPPCRDEENNASNGETAVKNALALLDIKRKELFSQICIIEDELASCEDHFQKIRDGGDPGLARHCIDSIVRGNDDLLLRNETQIEDCNPQSENQTGSSNIFLPGRSSCQDLEYICQRNNWRMPRYFVKPSEGKFTSNAIVGSNDFELSSKGGLENSPCEARESAAAQLIAKIHATV